MTLYRRHARTLRYSLCALAATVIAGFAGSDWSWGVSGREGLQPLGGGRYMAASVSALGARGLRGIAISSASNIGGQLVLTTGPGDSVRVEFSKILRAESAETASQMDRGIAVELVRSGDLVRLDIQTPSGAIWEGTDRGVTVEITMSVPANWDVRFDARFWECDLNGPFRDVVMNTEFGRVRVKNVTRRTDIRGNYTGIELSEVRGAIAARTTYADLLVHQAIPSADEPARLGNNSGAITVSELAGAVIVETQYAPISLSRVALLGATSRVYSQAAPVSIGISEFGRAQLDVRTSRSPVTLTLPRHLSARMNVSVGSGGSIQTSGLTIQTHPDQLSRTRLEGICGAGEGVIDVEASGASLVNIQGR